MPAAKGSARTPLGPIVFGQTRYPLPVLQTPFRSTESLLILRTIIEKSLKSGETKDRDISLIFIDLSKAYDCVLHQKLWDKLLALGFHLNIIKLLVSLYIDFKVKVVVNGHLTGEVSCQQGIKQGCVLSPLLFILYMAEVGSFLENHQSGIKL